MTVTYRQTLIAMALFGALLSAWGCNNNARVIAMQQHYVLDVVRPPSPPPTAEGNNVVRLRRFTIVSQYETYELVYRRSGLVYESDFYNRFFAPPAALIADKTRHWLSDSGVFAHVLGPFSGADSDYMLEGHIVSLYGDYRQKDEPQAVMEIQFTLIDEHRLHDSVVFLKKYPAVVPIDQDTAAQLVEGFNTCLAEILTQLETDLARLAPDAR